MESLKRWFFYFWVKNYKVSFLLVFLIIVYGFFSLLLVPKESSPDIEFWIITVSTFYPWVNPSDIDSLITSKIEKEIKDIDWINKITSTSSVWTSFVMIELENDVNTQDVLTNIKDKVDTIDIPEDATDPIAQELDTWSDVMFQALLYWKKEDFSNFKLNTLAKKVKNAIEWENGISEIAIWTNSLSSNSMLSAWAWEWDYKIKVLISKSKLEILWLSLQGVASTIHSYNKNTPIWNYTIWDLNYDFRIQWEFEDIEDLKNLTIKNNWWSKIKLWEIAEIKKEYDDNAIQSLWIYEQSWFNYIGLTFNKEKWSSIFSVSNKAKEELEEYIANNDEMQWLNIKYTNDLSEMISEDYKTLWNMAFSTLILVFSVILLFIWLRESLIASFLLPLAFLITFIVLNTLWMTLNFLTNFSLILSLWIAIDTVIVIIEWASERFRLWYTKENSILLAVKDLKSPLISWTCTTLVAFLPMIFLPWVMWRFLSYIPITIFSTLVAALLLSLTISSPLFIKFHHNKNFFIRDKDLEEHMKEEEKNLLELDRKDKKKLKEKSLSMRHRFLNILTKKYEKLLKIVLKNTTTRLLAIFVPIMVLIFTFVFLSPRIGFDLFPDSDYWMIEISLTAKNWTNEDSLKKYLDRIDNYLSSYPEMKTYYTTISWNKVNISVELVNKNDRERTVFDIEEIMQNEFKSFESDGLKVVCQVLQDWPPSGASIWVKLIANNSNKIDLLKTVSEDFENHLKTIPWTKNILNSSSDNPWQFVFHFDKDKLDLAWLNPNDIIWELYAYTFGLTAWSIKSTYEDNDIILKISDFDENLTPSDISNLVINTTKWKIKVWDFLEYKFDKSLSAINREDTKITITVGSDLASWINSSTQIQSELMEYAKNYNYPEWISYSAWWENQENSELIISVIQSFFVAIFLIFTILVFQFNSYVQPLIILYSVVLAILWVNVWLYVMEFPYSLTFWIWFIALTWIVVNDAIILIDKINKEMLKRKWKLNYENINKQKFNAIILAWKSRLQPIIVTTLTTVLWILPLAIQDAFWWGLGYTIVFGLFTWSFMTLFVMPALYYNLFYRKGSYETPSPRTSGIPLKKGKN